MPDSNALSRRDVLGAAAALAALPLLATRAEAQTVRPGRLPVQKSAARARPRYLHAAVGLPDGRVVVIGGYGVSEATRSRSVAAPTSSVQAYDPQEDAWTDLAPLATPRARHAAVLLPDGRIAVLGGMYAAPVTSVEVYDPQADAWSAGESLPVPLVDHAATVCSAGILLTGGNEGSPARIVPIPL